ncbi:RNA polymerase sigma factor [Xylophilus sp.]|uniref:RNA polymerase sigma factor n=1 Tax=Xylophilus sp. TaxID=2653893 RepID=UPI002D7FBAB5|nr:RNA polymerase sigma factor [Xylophilus sp.]
MLRHFTRAVKDAHEAQDLAQETFGRVLARMAAGERIDNLRALLYEVARNLLIDRHRQLRVRDHTGDEELLHGLPGPASNEPEVRYAARQRVLLLMRAIEALPLRCRQAFVLHRLDGLPQAEVARRMGISVNMVERHVMLAVAACRKALGDERSHRAAALVGRGGA